MTTKKSGPTKKATKTPAKRTAAPTTKRRNTVTQEPARAAGRQTKKDLVLALLRRPDGATIDELMAATGWQAHSIRGFISGTVKKQLELTVITVKNERSERAYRVVRQIGAERL